MDSTEVVGVGRGCRQWWVSVRRGFNGRRLEAVVEGTGCGKGGPVGGWGSGAKGEWGSGRRVGQ